MLMSFTNSNSLSELVEVYINLKYKDLSTIMAAIVNFSYAFVVVSISFQLETIILCNQLNKYQYNLGCQGCTGKTAFIIPYTLNVT